MSRRLSGWFLALVCATSAAPVSAAEFHFQYLDGLRKQGLGDIGAQYLRKLDAEKKIPADLVETFDLELARCLQVAAQFTENVDEAGQLRLDTRTQLDKFLAGHAEHEEAASAYDTFGVLSLSIGHSHLKQGKALKDAERKQKLYLDARTAFEEARPRFEEAVKRFKTQYDTLQAQQPTGDLKNVKVRKAINQLAEKKLLVEDNWLNARFNLAMVDYHVAQTYVDPKDPAVKPLLEKADKSLDSIWQGYRGLLPGLLAHHWTARVNEQLGKTDKALDIFEEVTGNEPEEGDKLDPYLAEFFAENFLQRIKLLNKLNRREIMLEDAEAWLDENSLRKTDAYYGVFLEVARAYITEAEKDTPENRQKTMTKVVRSLRDVTKVDSSYKSEAILMFRQYAKSAGEESEEAKTFAEAVALADSAAQNRDFKAAAESYAKALTMKDQEKNAERIDTVEYYLAYARQQSGDTAGSLAIAEKFAREKPTSKLGPQAAVLAINSAYSLCAVAKPEERANAEKVLNGIVAFTIETWPNYAEADDARIALGKLKYVQNDIPAAITALEKVNTASTRYRQAQSLRGQYHWRAYTDAKRVNPNDEAAKQQRQLAQTQFEEALKATGASVIPADELVADECRLYLGELHLEGAQPQLAVEMFTPLEAKIRATNPEALDVPQMRTLIGMIRAQSGLNAAAAVQASGEILLEKGQDIAPVNAALSLVFRNLRDAHKANAARVIGAIGAMPTADEAARLEGDAATLYAEATKTQAVLANFLLKFSPRQQLPVTELILIGDTASEINESGLAKTVYQRVLDSAQTATSKTPQMEQSLIRVKSAQIGLLRNEQKYDEALTLVDELIKSVPNALDPQIERARILQGLGATDSARFAEAATAWSKLRNAFQRSPKKPAAYYEIVYNLGYCLHEQGNYAPTQQAKADFNKQATQLLKATLALAPDLNGPDMVARYNNLLTQLQNP